MAKTVFQIAALVAGLLAAVEACAQSDNEVALNMGNNFYSNNNTYTDATLHVWETATPASQNMNAARLNQGASNLAGQSKSASLLVVRGRRLIHESYFHNATAAQAKNIHSASKTITAALTGIAIDEGLLTLSTRIGDVLPHSMSSVKQSITVSHLLQMKSGISWTEDSTEYNLSTPFVQAILNRSQSNTPGSSFKYSTGDAYLMGAVLAEAAGTSLHQYARAKLFDPLGIDVERWGRDTQGYFVGGHNFWITPREMARFGDLLAYDGRAADGTQLIPAAWATAMGQSHSSPSYYGYYTWLDATLDGHRGYRAWGWGKNFIYVFPDDDLTVVITHDTTGSVSDSDLNSFVRQYVIGAIEGPAVQPPPPAPPVLPGDFNEDGIVDAADYTVWRNTNGDAEAYAEWKGNYGASVGAGGWGLGAGGLALDSRLLTLDSPIPEPPTLWSVAVVLAAGAFAMRPVRRRRGRATSRQSQVTSH